MQRILLLVLGAWLAAAAPALAEPSEIADCGCDTGRLVWLQEAIAAAPTAEDARALAAPPLSLAASALARASSLLPGSKALEASQRRLETGEQLVASAGSPAAVASAFGVAVSGKPVLADVEVDPPSCHYTTLEIVAIVLGFILGIIPGLILLVLLC